MDEKAEHSGTTNPEEEMEQIEELVDSITEDVENKCFNFLINASNQANNTNTYNLSSSQLNSLFVLIHPYYIESFNLEDVNLNIKMNGEDSFSVNGKEFKAIEIQPGIRVFAITKNSED